MKPIGSAPPVSGWICVIVVAIGAHQHSKQGFPARGRWTLATLPCILLIV
jgi:hypothetical protein